MRATVFFCLLTISVSTIYGQWNHGQQTQSFAPIQPMHIIQVSPNNPFPQGDANYMRLRTSPTYRIPFPQCLSTETANSLINAATLQNMFQSKLQQEEAKLKKERLRNDNMRNNDIMDTEAIQLRSDVRNAALIARVGTKVAEELMAQLGCEINATVTEPLNRFLRTIRMPASACTFDASPDCNGYTHYRTISGVCNNLQRPYDGSSQTAYARLLPAAYDNGLNLPRSQSVLGGPLPGCREISLSMSSKPVFDTSYNNFFVAYGQFLVHDLALSSPVTDTGRTPISSCSCSSRDPEMCTVIDISSNDPYMAGQKCMAMPASAQAFSDQICTLGVKEHMNSNTHYIDLSVTYGSTKQTAHGLRTGKNGLLKSAKKSWSKFDLLPGQREGKSCTDGTDTQRCFAGGDSRLMENVLLSGLQAQWLRVHNAFVDDLAKVRPDWKQQDHILYEETKSVLSALHQRYTYESWLPILIGKEATEKYTGHNGLFSRYDPSVRAVIFNEAASAALRLHTLVRDLYTRCTPKGQLIDQVWLHDISAKCKYAYDAKNNGVDSLICGSMFDYGFAGDANYAQDIHHRLLESKNDKGEVSRNDIVSINICRAREHGIPGYNALRQFCGLRRANQFQDFSDTMPADHIAKLQSIYKHPDDVDLFIGINHENHVPGGLVGPVSACIIGRQFRNLKFGDRFFYSHGGQLSKEQVNSINIYPYWCFVCDGTDIEKVPLEPFRPPDDKTNPLQLCSSCEDFDWKPWRLGSYTKG